MILRFCRPTIWALTLIFFVIYLALPCDLNPAQCQNGGTCTNDHTGGFACQCETGYTGVNCETGKVTQGLILIAFISTKINPFFTITKVLPCDLNPEQCKNAGTCINDNVGSHACICANGYTDIENCEIGLWLLIYSYE